MRAVAAKIRIGQVGLEHRVVGGDDRAQQQRLLPKEQQLEPGEKASAVVIDAFLARFARDDIPSRIEHRERVAVLEDTQRRNRAFRIRDDRKALVEVLQERIARAVRRRYLHRLHW